MHFSTSYRRVVSSPEYKTSCENLSLLHSQHKIARRTHSVAHCSSSGTRAHPDLCPTLSPMPRMCGVPNVTLIPGHRRPPGISEHQGGSQRVLMRQPEELSFIMLRIFSSKSLQYDGAVYTHAAYRLHASFLQHTSWGRTHLPFA